MIIFPFSAPLSLEAFSMGLSCQHNSMWVTFVCKTFHRVKMFYLISQSSFFCPWQSIIHHWVQRVISYEINQHGRKQDKIPDLGETHRVSGSAVPTLQDPALSGPLGPSCLWRGTVGGKGVIHPSRYHVTVAEGPGNKADYPGHKISHLGAPVTVLREIIYLPEPLSV